MKSLMAPQRYMQQLNTSQCGTILGIKIIKTERNCRSNKFWSPTIVYTILGNDFI